MLDEGEGLVFQILMRRITKCILLGKHSLGRCTQCGIHVN